MTSDTINSSFEMQLEKLVPEPSSRDQIIKLISDVNYNCVKPKIIKEQVLREKFKNQSVFMALLHRQNSIKRWTKSQSIHQESLNDHCASVAYLGLLIGARHKMLNPESKFSPERLTIFCLFHDSPETLGEDLNGVLKGSDPKLKTLIKETESLISKKMAATIDPVLSDFVSPYFLMDCTDVEKDLVKAADILSAYAKAISELRSNNADFAYAAGQLARDLQWYMDKYEAVKFVYDNYIQAFELTIDEIIKFLPLID